MFTSASVSTLQCSRHNNVLSSHSKVRPAMPRLVRCSRVVSGPGDHKEVLGRNVRRREMLQMVPGTVGAALVLSHETPAVAAPKAVKLSSKWETEAFAAGTTFEQSAYESMRDDAARTPLFEKALNRRLNGTSNVSVVDVGTGPFAVLAICAAKAGARQVYAIEADPTAAKLAREAIAREGLQDRVQVIEGLSTAVDLPEKVDLLVAEVIGSVATEEGVYRTIRDAQARFMLNPEDPRNYIPFRVQTLVAPAAYAFHYMIAAEGRKAAGLASEDGPLRLNCTDKTLALMDEPQVLEDFRYNDPNLPGPGLWTPPKDLLFTVSSGKLAENTRMFMVSLGFDGIPVKDAKLVSEGVAKGFSGIAMWPRLILDEEEDLVVEARGVRGQAQKSHWQTVLPLMVQTPLPLLVGDTIKVSASANFSDDRAPAYQLDAEIRRA